MYSTGGFPALIKGDGNVKVELYSVDDLTLSRLDSLEGYDKFDDDGMYLRRTIKIGAIVKDDGYKKKWKWGSECFLYMWNCTTGGLTLMEPNEYGSYEW